MTQPREGRKNDQDKLSATHLLRTFPNHNATQKLTLPTPSIPAIYAPDSTPKFVSIYAKITTAQVIANYPKFQ